MSLEGMLRSYFVKRRHAEKRAKRKRRKVAPARRILMAGTAKKEEKEMHWCPWCDTIGRPCGRK